MPGLKERAKTLVDLAASAAFLARSVPLAIDAKAQAVLTPDARTMLGELAAALAETDFSASSLDSALRGICRCQRPQTGPGGATAARRADRRPDEPRH